MGGGEWDGTLTQYLVLDDSRVFRAPAGLMHVEASTLFTAGATAYNGLFYGEPKVGPGVTVLTQGTGGCELLCHYGPSTFKFSNKPRLGSLTILARRSRRRDRDRHLFIRRKA